MKIALVGNGLEIEFQKQLTKENMIINALEGKLSHNGVTQKSNFPSAIKVFADTHKLSYENIDKNPHRWKWLEEALKSESSNKSIEDLFMDIETALQDSEAAAEFKSIFLKYIEYFSSEVKSDFFEKEESRWNYQDKKYHSTKNKLNFLNEKFRNYDMILTTNYTNFIEKNLSEENKDKVVHLHGEFYNQDNPPLLGVDKFANAEKIMLKVEENITEGLEKIKNEEVDLTKIELDIFGWSFNNEHDLIQVIINNILNWYYEGNHFTSETSYDYVANTNIRHFWQVFLDGRKWEIVNLKPIIKINYYYYIDKKNDSNDLTSAERYKTENEKFWKGSNLLEQVLLRSATRAEFIYKFPTISWQQEVGAQNGSNSCFIPFDKPIKFETYPHTNFSLTNDDLEQFKK